MMEKSEIGEFSKQFSQGERDKTAEAVRLERKKYFTRKESESSTLVEVQREIEERRGSFHELSKRLHEIESSIRERENSSFTSFLDTTGLSKEKDTLFSEKEEAEKRLKDLDIDFVTLEDDLLGLEESRRSRDELENAKAKLQEFYKKQEVEAISFLKEQRELRDMKNTVIKHDVVFVHGTHPSFVPGENSILNRGVDWQTKADIALALSPTLSTSSIKEGDNPAQFFSRVGFILRDGSFELVSGADAATVARGVNSRDFYQFQPRLNAEDIKSAVNRQNKYNLGMPPEERHNEFVISSPKVAGLYVNRDPSPGYPFILPPIKEIADYSKKRGLRLFEMTNGVATEVVYDGKKDDFQPVAKWSPKNIIEDKSELSDATRNQIIEGLLNKTPFRLLPPELVLIDCRAQGRQQYIRFIQKELNNFRGKETSLNIDQGQEEGEHLPPDTKVEVITKFPKVNGVLRFFKSGNQLYKQRVNVWGERDIARPRHVTKTEILYDYEKDRSTGGIQGSYIEVGFFTFDTKKDIRDIDSYFVAMENAFKVSLQLKSEGLERAKGNPKWQERIEQSHTERVGQFAMHLYGFGEQAEEFGDLKTKDRAWALADQHFSIESCRDVIKRRIDSKGHAKITPEELGVKK